jgi:hypothetical protein
MSFDNDGGSATTALELALAWGFVGIPLLWGVYGTLVNAMKLFQYRRFFIRPERRRDTTCPDRAR